VNRPCPRQAFLGGFPRRQAAVGPAVGLPLTPRRAKAWDGAALSRLSQTQRLPGPQAWLAARLGFSGAPRSPAEPGIPAALGKLGLASPAQRPASPESFAQEPEPAETPGLDGSHTHTAPSCGSQSELGTFPTHPGRAWDCSGVQPIVPRRNTRVRRPVLTCCRNGS